MKYGEITENYAGDEYYRPDEDLILDEAYSRLDDKQKKKFEAYEEGYALFFKDYEQWFERCAPEIWHAVLDELYDERVEAEEIIAGKRAENEQRERQAEKEFEEYNRMIDREFNKDRI